MERGKRIRDIRQGPDGAVYVLTAEPAGETVAAQSTRTERAARRQLSHSGAFALDQRRFDVHHAMGRASSRESLCSRHSVASLRERIGWLIRTVVSDGSSWSTKSRSRTPSPQCPQARADCDVGLDERAVRGPVRKAHDYIGRVSAASAALHGFATIREVRRKLAGRTDWWRRGPAHEDVRERSCIITCGARAPAATSSGRW